MKYLMVNAGGWEGRDDRNGTGMEDTQIEQLI
jgi:hypothetical protein